MAERPEPGQTRDQSAAAADAREIRASEVRLKRALEVIRGARQSRNLTYNRTRKLGRGGRAL